MITRQEIALPPEAETLQGEIAAVAPVPPAAPATEPEAFVATHFLEAVTAIEARPVPAAAPDPAALAPVAAAAAPDPTATVQEQLDDVDALVRRLERDPADPVAGDLLEAIYARRGEREEIVALLLDRAEATEDPEARAGFLVRAARLYRTDLGDLAAAGMVLITALRAVPGDRRVHEELDALVCATGEFAAARAAYADAAVALAVEDPELAGELWLRVVSLHIMDRAGRGGPAAACAAITRIARLDLERARPVLELCERLAGDVAVLDALADLYRRLGDRAGVARVLSLSIAHVPDPEGRASRHHAIGELAAQRGDDLEAEWHLAEALRLSPARARSRAALAALCRRQGQARRAARLLEEGGAFLQNPVDRARLASEAAAIYAEELGERTRALDLYRQVLDCDPERADAAAPLAERYWQKGQYAQLEPLIEMLVRRAHAAGSPAEIAELSYRAGRTALELGRPERALEHLQEAIRLEPGRLEVLHGLARAAASLGRREEVHEAIDAALAVVESGRAGPGAADLVADLGVVAAEACDERLAIDLYRAALAMAPAHQVALDGAAALHRRRGEHTAAAELLRAAAQSLSGEARARVLAELAAVEAHGLGDQARALATYREALALAPRERAVLSGLAEVAAASGCWREAVDALTALAELEPDSLRRGRYLHIAARLARRRLGDEETASLLSRALDCLFAAGEPPADVRALCLRVFSDLEEVLRGQGALKDLERAYRAMIRRLGASAPELPELWTRLGALYRDELGQPQAAAESYEVAAVLEGEGRSRARLIDVHEGLAGEELGELIARRQRLLAGEPLAVDHYRALAHLFRRAGRSDQALMALRAVDALGAASAEERDRLAKLEAGRPTWPSAPISRELRCHLRHRDEDAAITGVLALASDAIAAELAVPPRRLGLRDDTSPAWQSLRDLHAAIAGLIGVQPPRLYVCPELDIELVYANLAIDGRSVLALAAGRRLLGASRERIVHALARALAHARPAYSLVALLPAPGALDAALDAALLVGGAAQPAAVTPAARQFADALERRLSPAFRAHLAAHARAISAPREALDVDRWADAVAATARRTALLLCDDLRAAAAALARDLTPTRWSREEVLADLLAHSCSDDFAAVRAAIGLAIS